MKARKLLALIPILFLISAGCDALTYDDPAHQRVIETAEAAKKTAFAELPTRESQVKTELPASPTPAFSWEGDWTIWIFIDPYDSNNCRYDGRTDQLTVFLSQSDYTISGSFTNPDGTGSTIDGDLSPDYRAAFGTLDSIHKFEWRQVSADQFIGNVIVLTFCDTYPPSAMCGARNGASKPDPCLGP